MTKSPARKKLENKLSTQSDEQLITLYVVCEESKDELDIRDAKRKQHSIVQACIESVLAGRVGQKACADMINALYPV